MKFELTGAELDEFIKRIETQRFPYNPKVSVHRNNNLLVLYLRKFGTSALCFAIGKVADLDVYKVDLMRDSTFYHWLLGRKSKSIESSLAGIISDIDNGL